MAWDLKDLTAATKDEITQWTKSYDFNKWVKMLDKKADEAKKSGKYKQTALQLRPT